MILYRIEEKREHCAQGLLLGWGKGALWLRRKSCERGYESQKKKIKEGKRRTEMKYFTLRMKRENPYATVLSLCSEKVGEKRTAKLKRDRESARHPTMNGRKRGKAGSDHERTLIPMSEKDEKTSSTRKNGESTAADRGEGQRREKLSQLDSLRVEGRKGKRDTRRLKQGGR